MNIFKPKESTTTPKFISYFIQNKTIDLVNVQTELAFHIQKSQPIEEWDDYIYVFSNRKSTGWVIWHDYSPDAEYIEHLACMHKNASVSSIEERARLLRKAGIQS